MNEAQKKTIQYKLGHLEDDLFRYKLQQERLPTYVSGNHEPIADIIARLEVEIAELKEGL